uniref:Ig-like domain-containing protein n=2 Tax=Scleropages formosus TaxID=113540 RepID=A0A8C9QTA2_SCLFO
MVKVLILAAVLVAMTATAQENQEPCTFKPVGGSATILLQSTNLDPALELIWKLNNTKIFQRKRGKVSMGNESDVTKEGSLKLRNLQLQHAGLYEAEVYDTKGKQVICKEAMLCVMERVSRPMLNYSCDEDVVLTCHSDSQVGHVMFNWTRNSQVMEGEEGPTVTVPGRSGLGDMFSCLVWNKASAESSSNVTIACEDPTPSYTKDPSNLKSYRSNSSPAATSGNHLPLPSLGQFLQFYIFTFTLTTYF